jgi:hypothetical protein
MPICGNCGERSTFTYHSETVYGSRGLSYDESWGMDHEDQEWLTCDNCGAKTDDAELKRWQEDEDDEDAEEADQVAYDQAAYPRTLSAQLRQEW